MLSKQELEIEKRKIANQMEQFIDSLIGFNRTTNISVFDAQDIKRMALRDFDNREITEFSDIITFIMKTTI